MTARSRLARSARTLSTRVFVGVALIVAVVLGVVLAIASTGARRAERAAAERGLEQSADLVAQLLSGRGRSLAGGARVFVQGPYFRTLVAEHRRDDILDQTFEAAEQLGAAWVFIIDANGVLVAKSDEPSAHGDVLSGVALVSGALRGQSTSGYGGSGDSLLFLASGVPIAAPGGSAFGVLVATTVLDSTIAADIALATGGLVVFYVRARDGSAHVTASTTTLARDVRVALETQLREAPDARATLTIDGDSWLRVASPLNTAGGEEVGGYVVLRRASDAPPGVAALRGSLVVASVVGLVAALIAALVAARSVSRPLDALANDVQALADGAALTPRFAVQTSRASVLAPLGDALEQWLAVQRDRERIAAALRTPGPVTETPVVTRPRDRSWPQTPRSTSAVLTGTLLADRYDIEAVLGRGGSGVVYRAFDRVIGDRVAIKVLHRALLPFGADARALLSEEVRLARRVTHAHVVRLHDVGEADGMAFLTMELVDGPSLAAVVASHGALAPDVVEAIARQLLRGLAAAHEHGVVHGDLKPHNVLVASDGAVKLTDFGVAQLVRHARHEAAIRTPTSGTGAIGRVVGATVGTPAYMAPELLIGAAPSERSDLYALGVVLQECVAGSTPHVADTPIALLGRKLGVDDAVRIPPPSAPPSWLHGDAGHMSLDDVIAQLTVRDPSMRPTSARRALELLSTTSMHADEPGRRE